MSGTEMSATPGGNPFVGPRPFHTGETLYGRDEEIRSLFYRFNADRIVVLHSPSGAGKSSLVEAGLIPILKQEGFDVWPTIRVNQDPQSPKINRYVIGTLLSLEEGVPEQLTQPFENLRQQSLLDYVLQRPKRRSAPPCKVLIFDQFEELLTVEPLATDEKRDFFIQLGDLLRTDRNVWALFVMREDYLAPFDPYVSLVPTQFNNRFRLDLLGEAGAKAAIIRPLEAAGRSITNSAVDKLFRDLATVSVQQPDGTFVKRVGQHVEPVQLQVVCHRLWGKMEGITSNIDLHNLTRFGDVNEALSDYYAASVAEISSGHITHERDIREWVSEKLITSTGIRGQVLRGVSQSDGLSNDTIRQLVGHHLLRIEKRRGADWFELAHDRLIEPILSDNSQWFELKLSTLQKRAHEWQKQHRPEGLLLKGDELRSAKKWAQQHAEQIAKIELEFLKRSQDERLKSLMIKWLAIVSVIVAIIAICFFISAEMSSNLAQQRLSQVLRLSDMKRLSELKRESEALWPATPDKIPEMRNLLAEMELLHKHREAHREALQILRSQKSDALESKWQLEKLEELVSELDTFFDADPTVGAFASLKERLAFATQVRAISIVDARAEWETAIASIADQTACPKYGGMRIRPQLGLIPIQRDPHSGLWDFWHIQTGARPTVGPEGELQISAATGLVFTLLPSGTATIGTDKRDDSAWGYADELPQQTIPLKSFFISKYEMTQAQWQRFTGEQPSAHSGADHPVEQISWFDCDRVLLKLGLCLPTEAQWEYAARGETLSPWWTGDDKNSLSGAANLADSFASNHGLTQKFGYEEWLNDGEVYHAAVGSYRPNPFGIHDVAGNVWEWCRDCYDPHAYEQPFNEGDGYRPLKTPYRVARGGSYYNDADSARSAFRYGDAPGARFDMQGVRPARNIDE